MAGGELGGRGVQLRGGGIHGARILVMGGFWGMKAMPWWNPTSRR